MLFKTEITNQKITTDESSTTKACELLSLKKSDNSYEENPDEDDVSSLSQESSITNYLSQKGLEDSEESFSCTQKPS